MHSLSVYGRLISRSIVSGLYNNCSSSTSASNSAKLNGASPSEAPSLNKLSPHLVSAMAGFPKDFKSAKVRKGQIGDDAWLVTSTKSADVLGISDDFTLNLVFL